MSSQSKTKASHLPAELRASISMVLQALDRDAAEGRPVRGEMAAELRKALDGVAPTPSELKELREHILHMRRELTRADRSPLTQRQRLAERVTSLLDALNLLAAPAPEDGELHQEFISSGGTCYMQWLEAQLKLARANA